ncbi:MULTISPECIES: MerR family transcriptional regulator [unclassified Clostridium]|uniref:MerR family transcriptional regulator n=1 Tax=unclassified Clostridium TaxID=2614128 RepID=UPI00029743C3|nr:MULTISPECIES: MerR family transcriptional regulator [unclassified Clostridium]EKQ54293.1 MAG: putative transcriptional regulator [Clostridium sp. Maddingley MBC34-26]
MDEELFSIGKFSKICSVSIQALRYYDKIGILKPKFIDTETGYRFYSTNQIVIVMIIRKMAALGLSLSEIDVFLHRNDMSGIKSIFNQKRQEIKEQIDELLYADKILKLNIDNIDMHNNIDFSCIEIKKIPPRKVIYLRKTIELSENGFTKLFNDAMKIVSMKKYSTIGNPMAIYYGERVLGEPCDIELCIELEEAYTSEENCKIIQGGYYLSKMHLGAHNNKPKTYGQLIEYADRNKLSIIGNPMEVYYIDISITRNPDDFITEIQIPIKNKLTL